MSSDDNNNFIPGELNTKSSHRKVWLVKVPTFLADAWSKVGNNVELGSVRIREEKGAGKLPEMSIVLKGDYPPNFPKDYDLLYSKPDTTMHVFYESPINAQVSAEGTVENKCDVKPHNTEEYRKIIKGRHEKSLIRTRVTQTIDDLEVKLVTGFNKKRKVEDKRERMEKNDLLNLLFSKFEKNSYYDMKTLAESTKQPVVYLKSLLDEICIYNKRGPHKGCFELKAQYKHRSTSFGTVDLKKEIK